MKTKSKIQIVSVLFLSSLTLLTTNVLAQTAGGWLYLGANTYTNPLGNSVGIGIATPTAPLDIANSTKGIQLRAGNSNVGSSSNQLLLSYSGSTGYTHAIKTRHNSGSATGNAIDFYVWNQGVDALGTVGTKNVMTLDGNGTGYVGIGTTTPSHKLHINNGPIRLTGTTAGLGGPNLLFGNLATDTYAGEWGMEYMSNSAYPSGPNGLNFWKPFGSANWGNYYLFLSDNGKIGIKTSTPTANLTVNGNVLIGDPATVTLPAGYKLYVQTGILTEKVKVSVCCGANWSDYVFNADYKLRSIGELENYLLKHKHLPNIPSAEEVVKDGIDLAMMDAKLLEKIEELSLYIIQQNKRIEVLEQKIAVK